VNESGAGFTPLVGAIRYGLAAVKGVGQNSVGAIVAARADNRFGSLFDFTARVNPGAVTRKVMESLGCAGAFDSLNSENQDIHLWRARLNQGIDAAISHGSRLQRDKSVGQNDLFDAAPDEPRVTGLPNCTAWTHTQLLAAEKNAIGFYITGHPLDNYVEVLEALGAVSTLDLPSMETGTRFALMRIEDQAGSVKCVAWPEAFSRFETRIIEEAAVLVQGNLEVTEDGAATVFLDDISNLDNARQQKAGAVVVRLPESPEQNSLLADLFKLFNSEKGDCEVLLELFLEGGVFVRVKPHTTIRVKGSSKLETAIKAFNCGVEWKNVSLEA
jgi:DNA polymerase-3 subunit alpha